MPKPFPVKKVADVTKLAGSAANSLDALAVIREALEYLKIREQERTKREMIWSKRDVLVTALNNEKEVILAYFEHRFKERKATLEQFYDVLHRATRSGDSGQLQIALDGILGIVKENPLKDFAEFRKNMSNPDFVIEL